jgi:hypothetical protein
MMPDMTRTTYQCGFTSAEAYRFATSYGSPISDKHDLVRTGDFR